MPKISVVIPAYNAEEVISETIKSVQQQTFSDWEIISINDGSTDNTLGILSSIGDKRLKVFSYENAGVSVARNRGIAHSTGEFIVFLDADDLWLPDCLELLLAALEQHPKAHVSYGWFSDADERGNILQTREVFFEGDLYPHLLVENFLQCGILLIRKQAIESVGEFDPSLIHFQDWDYFIRLARHLSFVLVPKSLLLYRKWRGSANSKLEKLEQYERSQSRAIEKAFQSAPIELQCLKNQRLVKLYLKFARNYMARYTIADSTRDDVKQAGQKLQKALQLEPKILLRIGVLKLIGEWLLLRALSGRGAGQLMRIYRVSRRIIRKLQPPRTKLPAHTS